MRSCVINGDVWNDACVLAAAKDAKKRVFCVSYVTRKIRGLFRRGDILVCDASDAAQASGETDPRVLLQLLNAGVLIFSYEGLHVKCAILGNKVLVGSANMSESSATRLTDMSVLYADRQLSESVSSFVLGLLHSTEVVELNREMLQVMVQEFKPKQQKGVKGAGKKQSVRRGRRDWLMNVHDARINMSEEEYEEVERQGRVARSELKDALWWLPGEPYWYRTKNLRELTRVAPGDRIVMVDHASYRKSGRADVYGPGVIYAVGQVGSECVVHYTCPRKAIGLSELKRNRLVHSIFPKGISNYPNRHVKSDSFDVLCGAIRSIKQSKRRST